MLREYTDLIVELVVIDARIVSGTPKPLGANDLRYLSPAEIKALPFCEADIPLLDALESGAIGR